MKLNSRDKVILAVFLVIVILGVGIFLFIMPEYNKIETNNQELESAKEALEQAQAVLARESTIDQEIEDAYKEANKLSENFYDDMTTYECDELVRQILKETDMRTNSLSIDSFTTSTLTVSDYVETFVNYPLKELSGYTDSTIDFSGFEVTYDENGEMVISDEDAEKYKDYLKDAITYMLSSQSQTIGSISASFTMIGTRANYLEFLDYIAGLEKATYVNGATIAYTSSQTQTTTNENGETETTTTNDTKVSDNQEMTFSVNLTFYCVKPLEQTEITSAEETAAPETA